MCTIFQQEPITLQITFSHFQLPRSSNIRLKHGRLHPMCAAESWRCRRLGLCEASIDGSMTDSKCSEIHLRVTLLPGSCPPPSTPLGAAGSAVTPAYRPRKLHCLTHRLPLPLSTSDGRVEAGQPSKVGCGRLTSHYVGLVSCHYFWSPSVLRFTAGSLRPFRPSVTNTSSGAINSSDPLGCFMV